MLRLEDLPITKGKRVLVRVSFDVPLDAEGNPLDLFRIERTLPTLKYLLEREAKVILLSKLGHQEDLSLQPLVKPLEQLLEKPVIFVEDCTGSLPQKVIAKAKPGDVILLENLRFHPEEKANDLNFAKELSLLGDIYINDAFADSHRKHASIVSLPRLLPSGAGRLMFKEVAVLSHVILHPWRPLVAIIGGVKIKSKLGVLERFLDKADHILLGGEIANTLLRAKGIAINKPLLEEEVDLSFLDLTNPKLHLPIDVVASADKEGETYIKITAPAKLGRKELALDIGPETIKLYQKIIKSAKMIVWAGPLGYFENRKFERGTREIADTVARTIKAFRIAGGGDTIFALAKFGAREEFDFISTGGGAMLEFIAKGTLPGILALKENAI